MINYNRITLIEGEKEVSADREVAEALKSYSEAVMKSLGINSKYMAEEPVSNESVNNIIILSNFKIIQV